MRLWHIDLLQKLPHQQLLGQHREVCALRGAGWGKRHATVDYVFTHPYSWLFGYHMEVMREMRRRGYKADPLWWGRSYRGKTMGCDMSAFVDGGAQRYPEHDAAYLVECINNLASKGIVIEGVDHGNETH